jgi:hypothetical protein
MARRYATASSDYLRVASRSHTNYAGTVALVHRATSDAAEYRLCTNADASNAVGCIFYRPGGMLGCYDQSAGGASSNSTIPFNVAVGWAVIAITKAAGTATPRFHLVPFSTGAPSHQNGGATMSDGGSAGVRWEVGASTGFGNWSEGDFAAFGTTPRVMSDSEIEQMARGDWWRFNLANWREFPAGRDVPDQLGSSIGYDRTVDHSRSGGIRSPLTDPPGFRFSMCNRRR